MKTLLSVSTIFALMLSVHAPASAAEAPGLAVGKKAPAFKLKDQKGKEQSLEALLKKRNVAIVFYRSADW
jgi:cytochrome oxidase Cu insertion factor (SCO1/SenC/PrrC family)